MSRLKTCSASECLNALAGCQLSHRPIPLLGPLRQTSVIEGHPFLDTEERQRKNRDGCRDSAAAISNDFILIKGAHCIEMCFEFIARFEAQILIQKRAPRETF